MSHIASKLISHHGYDEVLILKKGVPFLDADIPHDMDSSDVVASDLCERMSEHARLKPNSAVASVQKALEINDASEFPVVNNGMCIGVVARSRLEAVLAANEQRTSVNLASRLADHDAALGQRVLSGGHLCEQDKALGLDHLFATGAGAGSIPVHTIMDPAPYMLLKDMPAPRVYPLFSKAGAFSACVVSKRGTFEGLVSRRSIMEHANQLHTQHSHTQHSHKPKAPVLDGIGASSCSTEQSLESISAEVSSAAERSVDDSIADSVDPKQGSTMIRVQAVD